MCVSVCVCMYICVYVCVCMCIYMQGSTLTLVRLSGTSECFGRASEREIYLPNRTSNLKKSIPKKNITAFIYDIAFVIGVCDLFIYLFIYYIYIYIYIYSLR